MPDVDESGPLWRRITAGILLGLAVVAIILGPVMLYVRTQVLDSGAFRDRADTALASPAVQDYLADALTARLVARGVAVERAEPLVRAVAGGVVASDRFREIFGRAAGELHDRLLSGEAGARVMQLQEAVDRTVAAIAVVDPALAQQIETASGDVPVARGRAGEALAQIAHRAEQLRVLGVVLPVVAFVLLVLSVVVAPRRLRAVRRAGWGLIAGGAVVAMVVALSRRVLAGIAEDAEVRRAVADVGRAFLADLGTWGTWITAIGVVVLATSAFLVSDLTLRGHAVRLWGAATRRPGRTRVLVLRILLLVVVVLLAIFAASALVTLVFAGVIAVLVAYGLSVLLRLAGVDVGGRSAARGGG